MTDILNPALVLALTTSEIDYVEVDSGRFVPVYGQAVAIIASPNSARQGQPAWQTHTGAKAKAKAIKRLRSGTWALVPAPKGGFKSTDALVKGKKGLKALSEHKETQRATQIANAKAGEDTNASANAPAPEPEGMVAAEAETPSGWAFKVAGMDPSEAAELFSLGWAGFRSTTGLGTKQASPLWARIKELAASAPAPEPAPEPESEPVTITPSGARPELPVAAVKAIEARIESLTDEIVEAAATGSFEEVKSLSSSLREAQALLA